MMVRWCVVLVDCNFVLEVARPPPIKIGWLNYAKRLSLRLSRRAHTFFQARCSKQGILIDSFAVMVLYEMIVAVNPSS